MDQLPQPVSMDRASTPGPAANAGQTTMATDAHPYPTDGKAGSKVVENPQVRGCWPWFCWPSSSRPDWSAGDGDRPGGASYPTSATAKTTELSKPQATATATATAPHKTEEGCGSADAPGSHGEASESNGTSSAGTHGCGSGSSVDEGLAPKTGSRSLRNFKFKELQSATLNFDQSLVIGKGGFGKVYRGLLQGTGSEEEVAVKVMDEGGMQGVKEWMTEILVLDNLQHENLVRLVGYSQEASKGKLLVYELCRGGSLDRILFSKREGILLEWHHRVNIAVGAARGLEYLHDSNVIHRDFKPANVLLDEHLNARVTDFGLAREGPAAEQSHVTTDVKGTMAYLDPTYWATGHLTPASDAYAFGIFLLELVSGRRSSDGLLAWAKPLLLPRKPKPEDIVDPRLGGNYSGTGVVLILIAAKKCIEADLTKRPTMEIVRKHLERVLQLMEDDLKKDQS